MDSRVSSRARGRREPSLETRTPGRLVSAQPAGMIAGAMLARDEISGLADVSGPPKTVIIITPRSRRSFRHQAEEVLQSLSSALASRNRPMRVTVQTVFLRDGEDQAECERLFSDWSLSKPPITNYLLQPPCCGAELALEAWVVEEDSVRVRLRGPNSLEVSYRDARWIYCAGITPENVVSDAYEQTLSSLRQTEAALIGANSSFRDVVRTWFYLGSITSPLGKRQRYKELNRARTDFYQGLAIGGASVNGRGARGSYPASTGIGMSGMGLVVSCVAFQTRRADAKLVPLENPKQVPAYNYHPRYSPKSPKFSRGIALRLGDSVTTWVSGTASVLDSESHHLDDLEKQTEQTIDNIERLIGAENLAAHGLAEAGARLSDFAKIRVYLKHASDYPCCKAICERRFGAVPAVYALADICRPELLVEIEGVAFSRMT